MNSLLELTGYGQSIWLDNLSRSLIREGTLANMIEHDGITGVTSNPSILHKAISDSPYYADDLVWLKSNEIVKESRYESLVIADIQAACDLLRPVYDQSKCNDGYVSMEVAPRLAHDAVNTVTAAKRLFEAVARDNLLIKVPGTTEGLVAFEQLIAAGINVNVTLLFSLQHVVRAFEAFMRGLKSRLALGGDTDKIKAVASLFLSRIDTLIDKKLTAIGTEEALALRGKTAVAMSKLAFQRYKEMFHGDLFSDLAQAGCHPQHLLWASTSTKNPAYKDVLYVEPLIGPETINTLPDSTLDAFRDHGIPGLTVEEDVEAAKQHFLHLEKLEINMHAAGDQLQVEGVKLFDDAYTKLLQLVA